MTRSTSTRAVLRWQTLAPWMLIAAGVLVYSNTFGNPFIFDDAIAITGNRHIKTVFPLAMTARWLTDLTFSINYALDGLHAAGYHAVNMALHIAAGLVLWALLRRVLARVATQGVTALPVDGMAFSAALLWLVHPLQTGAVTYVCQRYESMAGLCYLSVIYLFVRAIECAGGYGATPCRTSSRTPSAWRLGGAVAIGILGMGTKETMATVPLAVLAFDGVLARRWADVGRRWKLHGAVWVSLVALAALELRMISGAMARGQETVSLEVSPWHYLLTQSEVILHYLRLVIWPHPQCIDYAWPPARSVSEVAPSLLVLVGLGVASLVGWCRRRPLALLGMWFFITLGTTSSVLPVPDAVAEHRMYLALAAPCVAGVLLVVWLTQGCRQALQRALRVGILVAVAVLFGIMTFRRNQVFASTEVMWRQVIAVQPLNFRQHISLTSALIREGKAKEAEAECRALLRAMDRAEAAGITGEGIPACTPARQRPVAWENLGRALVMQGRGEEAVACFRKAWDGHVNHALLSVNLAIAYTMVGDDASAREAIDCALDLDPDAAEAWGYLAYLHVRAGAFRVAAEAYEAALQRTPGLLHANLELGWLRATCPDAALRNGKAAEAHARRVLAVTGGQGVRALDVLAAALAEQGRMPEAVAVMERALQAAQGRVDVTERGAGHDWGPSVSAERLRERAAAYARGESWRDG